MSEFSKNLDEWRGDFFNLVVESIKDDKNTYIHLEREGNLIYFYRGKKQKNNNIEMISNNDLKKIYEEIEEIYGETIEFTYMNSTLHVGDFYLVSLVLCIEENTFIIVSSTEDCDQQWFRQKIKIYEDKKNDVPKIK